MALDLDAYMPYDAGAGATMTEGGTAGFTRGWRDLFGIAIPNGVAALVANELLVIGDSTGMQVKIGTGNAWVAGNGGFNLAQKVLAVAAAHATLERIDLVVCRNDFGANKMVFDIIAGTPATAGSQVAPAPTQNTSMFELPLAKVAVAHTVVTINAADVTDARAYVTERAPSARATRTAVQGVTSAASFAELSLTGTPSWNAGMTLSGAHVVTPVKGRFTVRGCISFAASNTTGIRRAGIMINDVLTDTINTSPGSASLSTQVNVSGTFDALANDTFAIGAQQDSGGNVNVTGWIEVTYVGPSANRP